MNEKQPYCDPADMESWPGVETFIDGSRLERSCHSDLATRLVVYESRLYRSDNSLASYSGAFNDEAGNLVINTESRRPDESLEFEGSLSISPETGIPVGDFKTYYPNRILECHDRSYINELGRLVLESSTFNSDGTPKQDQKPKQTV